MGEYEGALLLAHPAKLPFDHALPESVGTYFPAKALPAVEGQRQIKVSHALQMKLPVLFHDTHAIPPFLMNPL